MEIYRLSHADYADLSGVGGLYGAGRWHNKGALACYAASSRSLAALERLVHEAIDEMPPLTMMTIWVPDTAKILRYTEDDLAKGWDSLPDSGVAREASEAFFSEGKHLLMQVPSAVVRDEFNYVINPKHAQFSKVKIVEQREYYYDARLQRMIR